MIETRRLKNAVIFIQTILSFALSRKIINCLKYCICGVDDVTKLPNVLHNLKYISEEIDDSEI